METENKHEKRILISENRGEQRKKKRKFICFDLSGNEKNIAIKMNKKDKIIKVLLLFFVGISTPLPYKG